jgi:sensor histidine kinase regulating citrate/malate metabolism
MAEQKNEQMAQYYTEVENIYRQMSAWRHDFHNHLQTIKACIAMGHIDELSDFCDRLEHDLRSVDLLVKTGNVMLDAILNSKLSLAKSRGIDVHATANVPKGLMVSDIDLCSLMGNMLDNATEACARREGDAVQDFEFGGPFIRVYMGMKGHMLYLCVTNSVFGNIKKSGLRFLSTKANNRSSHGYGLIRIDKICEKYGGFCKRNSEPGVFTTEILLPALPE